MASRSGGQGSEIEVRCEASRTLRRCVLRRFPDRVLEMRVPGNLKLRRDPRAARDKRQCGSFRVEEYGAAISRWPSSMPRHHLRDIPESLLVRCLDEQSPCALLQELFHTCCGRCMPLP